MRFSHLSAGAIALLLVSVLALAAFGGAAAAQDGGANANGTTYEIAIDEQTRIVSSEWDGGTVTIVVESDVARRVTVTDASQTIDGAIDIRRTQATVAGDSRTEIEFTVENPERAAVTVEAGGSIVGLGQQPSGVQPFSGDPGWSTAHSAGLAGGLGGVSTAGLIVWSLVSRDPDGAVEERV